MPKQAWKPAETPENINCSLTKSQPTQKQTVWTDCVSHKNNENLQRYTKNFEIYKNRNKTLTFPCYDEKNAFMEVGSMFRILVVEDDKELNYTVCSFLNQSGYEAEGCLNANNAYNTMYNNTFDLIISDIMMPEIDGFEFAKTVRGLDENIPILFMTARDDFAAKQKGYRVGIDDYMVKPIDLDELFLRIGALLRRAKIASSHRLEIGGLVLDADERSAMVGGEEISLTVREFNILYKLLSYPKKTFTRTQLMDEFWDADSNTTPRAVDVYMTKLRDKFSECDDFEIVTVHGLGYKAVTK